MASTSSPHETGPNPALRYRRFGSPLAVLGLEPHPLGALQKGRIRVAMRRAPINPSDLIPVTGAYRHRVALPQTAGYEGVGVVTDAHGPWRHLLGRRVLPLRGPGTWCRELDCDPRRAVPVPEAVADDMAARAWINPMAALSMLKRWPVAGKRLIVTAAASSGARLLSRWALDRGARSVTGILRSGVHRTELEALGLRLLVSTEYRRIDRAAAGADLIFDAVGGPLAERLLSHMPGDARLICWGLLSGIPPRRPWRDARLRHFHLRHTLEGGLDAEAWQAGFSQLWTLLRDAPLPPCTDFALTRWREALEYCATPARSAKPMLVMPSTTCP